MPCLSILLLTGIICQVFAAPRYFEGAWMREPLGIIVSGRRRRCRRRRLGYGRAAWIFVMQFGFARDVWVERECRA